MVNEIMKLISAYDSEVGAAIEAEAARQRLVEDYTARMSEQTEEYGEIRGRLTRENEELSTQCAALEEANLGLLARVHAWQHKVGETPVEDVTSEEYFKQLEKERAWFDGMFDKTWKDTKKRIRKDLLWTKPEKKGKLPKGPDGE